MASLLEPKLSPDASSRSSSRRMKNRIGNFKFYKKASMISTTPGEQLRATRLEALLHAIRLREKEEEETLVGDE
jgi:hypothetical protein